MSKVPHRARKNARKTAAKRAAPRARATSGPPPKHRQVRELIHELQVYSEQITVQNEQLLKAQSELEEARDRFADLYDFAPIGYLSLDKNGLINEVNLCAVSLLARARALLLDVPLTTFVRPSDRKRLRLFLRQVVSSPGHGPAPHIEVTLEDGRQGVVRLIGRGRRDKHRLELLVAMIDVTQERHLEAEREKTVVRESARVAEVAREVADRMSAEERVKALLERLVGIQEEERRRLSRNLHDHLGQQLTALRLAIGGIKARGRSAGENNSRIGVIEAIVTDLDRDIDRLAWDLRPPALDDNGLSAALDSLVREWAAMTGVTAEFHVSSALAPEPRLARDIESHVYRIVQEALTNIAKHAQASRVSVLIKHAREELALIVEDDGHGFQEHRTGAGDAGMGLISMRERAALIGGQIQIESMAGRGATVFVKIPLKTPKPA
jgi:signal transduction histidine kinase